MNFDAIFNYFESDRQTGTHLHHPAGPPELDQPVKPPVYLLHLDADHVPEAGKVLAGRHKGILITGDVLININRNIFGEENFKVHVKHVNFFCDISLSNQPSVRGAKKI